MDISADNLSLSLSGSRILRAENVTCQSGRLTALIGPSGSGKTTLLHTLGLLLLPDRGAVIIDGRRFERPSRAERLRFWRESAAFVLQDYGIIDEATVSFNVTMGRARRASKWLTACLQRVGLGDRESEIAGRLSGGEKQRLAVARALYKDAAAIFVDEPTASLDAPNRELITTLLHTLADDGRTVIVSTHDQHLIDTCPTVHRVGGYTTEQHPSSPSRTLERT